MLTDPKRFESFASRHFRAAARQIHNAPAAPAAAHKVPQNTAFSTSRGSAAAECGFFTRARVLFSPYCRAARGHPRGVSIF